MPMFTKNLVRKKIISRFEKHIEEAEKDFSVAEEKLRNKQINDLESLTKRHAVELELAHARVRVERDHLLENTVNEVVKKISSV